VASPANAVSVVSTMILRRRKTIRNVVFVILIIKRMGTDEWMDTHALRIVHQDRGRDISMVESSAEPVVRRCRVFIDVAWRRDKVAFFTGERMG
jgi:hypothetical protein